MRFRPVLVSFCLLALFCSTGTVFAQVTDDDHGNTPETATTIQLSTSPTVSGRIELGDIDYFRIDITESTTITIFTSSDLRVTCRLQSNSGTELAADSDSGIGFNCLINYSFDPGTYYITVETFSVLGGGNYVLHLSADDDHGDTRATATPLLLNTVIEGIIAPGNDIDYFEIEITEPTLINLFTTDDLDTLGELQDNNGQVLETADDEGRNENFLITRNLPAGTYYITVRGKSRFDIGAYVLYADVEDHGRTAATATFVPLNTTISGTIIADFDIDYFEIETTERTLINIFTTGNLITLGSLLNSNQDVLVSARGMNFGERNFLIYADLEPGTYYITVNSRGFSTPVGDYVLHLSAGDDHGDTRATATPLPLNTVIEGIIEPITPDGRDIDYFEIEITEPSIITIFTTGNLNAIGTLQNSSGTNLMEDDDSGQFNNFLITDNLPVGTYYITVRGKSTSDIGAYVLYADVEDHGRSTATATPVPLNTTVSGTIIYRNDIDYFEIEITERTLLYIFTTGNLDTIGTLQNSSGTNLMEDDDSGLERNFLLHADLEPGTYYIAVDGRGSSTPVGDYILHVLTDDYENTTPTSTTIPLNTAVSGTIEHGDDIDYFEIVITEPTTVHLFTTGNLDTAGTLRNEASSFSANGDEELPPNFLITRSLDPGIYYIEVGSFGSAVGDYVLHVRTDDYRIVLADDHGNAPVAATNLSLNTSVSGTIGYENDIDYFRIEIPEQTQVEIFTTGDLDVAGMLLDNNLDSLASDDNGGANNNFLISALLESGTYYIEVGSSPTTSGDYVLHVNAAAVISFERAEYTITEGTTGTVTLVASVPPTTRVQVELTTLSATIANGKYRLSTTVVVFEPGKSMASFEVGIVDDDVVRSTRELRLSFDLPDGNVEYGATSETVISVGDNDVPVVTLTVVGDVPTLEAAGDSATLRVTLTHAFDQETTIHIVTDGTATEGEDYTISMNPVVFKANSTYAETTLTILKDDDESDGTIILTLDADNPLVMGDGPDGAKLTLTIGEAMLFFRIKVFLEGAQ